MITSSGRVRWAGELSLAKCERSALCHCAAVPDTTMPCYRRRPCQRGCVHSCSLCGRCEAD
jgi:hypothetical protein